MRLCVLPIRSAHITTLSRRTFTTSTPKPAYWLTHKRKEIRERNTILREMEANHSLKRAETPNYEDWTQESLIKRVTELENSLKLFNKYAYPTHSLAIGI